MPIISKNVKLSDTDVRCVWVSIHLLSLMKSMFDFLFLLWLFPTETTWSFFTFFYYWLLKLLWVFLSNFLKNARIITEIMIQIKLRMAVNFMALELLFLVLIKCYYFCLFLFYLYTTHILNYIINLSYYVIKCYWSNL